MKALPALPTVAARDVHRAAAERCRPQTKASAPAANAPSRDGVIRVRNKRLGITCPCSTPAIAAQLNEFFSR